MTAKSGVTEQDEASSGFSGVLLGATKRTRVFQTEVLRLAERVRKTELVLNWDRGRLARTERNEQPVRYTN
jgi:hypothetical protein